MKIIFDLMLAFIPGLIEKVFLFVVTRVRNVFLSLLFQACAVLLALCGFVMIHLALFFLLPWSLQTNAFILLGVGVFYFGISVIYLIKKTSVENWIKITGVDNLK